jgi:CRISPR type III-A-associated RAMP protein Csm4
LSSLLPQGFLPRPLLPFGLKQTKEEIDRNKKLKKVQWIPLALFAKLKEAFSMEALAQEQNIEEQERALCEKLLPVEVTRNSVSRTTGTVIEGILFTDSYLCAQGISFVVYVTEIDSKYSDMLQRAFMVACQMGLGREATIGKGVFSVTKAELDEVEKKVFGKGGNHFMSISLCAGHSTSKWAKAFVS